MLLFLSNGIAVKKQRAPAESVLASMKMERIILAISKLAARTVIAPVGASALGQPRIAWSKWSFERSSQASGCKNPPSGR